jgi:oxygen-independent coproporphyrinogen-3 oxidase
MDISRGYLDSKQQVVPAERPFEFFMNRFRLLEPCPHHEFTAFTGLALDSIKPAIDKAVQQGLLKNEQQQWQITDKGARFLNNLISLFID